MYNDNKGFYYAFITLCLQQRPGLNQGLCAVRVHHILVYTPLAPCWHAVRPSETDGGCWRASNTEHLSHFYPWALSPPALLPWHWCGSQWVRGSVHGRWENNTLLTTKLLNAGGCCSAAAGHGGHGARSRVWVVGTGRLTTSSCSCLPDSFGQ